MSTAPHIEALLRTRIGLDARSIGPGAIERALRERQAALQAHDVAAYWNLLHSQPDEFQALIEAWWFQKPGSSATARRCWHWAVLPQSAYSPKPTPAPGTRGIYAC